MRRVIPILLLVGICFTATACIIEERGPGPGYDRWCYNHPYRCH